MAQLNESPEPTRSGEELRTPSLNNTQEEGERLTAWTLIRNGMTGLGFPREEGRGLFVRALENNDGLKVEIKEFPGTLDTNRFTVRVLDGGRWFFLHGSNEVVEQYALVPRIDDFLRMRENGMEPHLEPNTSYPNRIGQPDMLVYRPRNAGSDNSLAQN